MFLAQKGHAEKVGLRPIAVAEAPSTRNMKGPLRSAPANPIAYLLLSLNFSLLRPRPRSMLIDEHFPVASWRERDRETENPAVSVGPSEYRKGRSINYVRPEEGRGVKKLPDRRTNCV